MQYKPSKPQLLYTAIMGALYQQTPTLEDLKVTLLATTTLHPPDTTERRPMFLSNIDQVLNFNVETVHFFEASPAHPFDSVAEKLRSAVEGLLGPYDFLAGRLRWSTTEGGRLEIDCNAAGVDFVVAGSELELGEVGELEYPNPAFRQLVQTKPTQGLRLEERPLCSLQVTSFKCGGFALGISTNHCAFDGASFRTFLENLAALTSNKPLAVTPFNDRRLLAARSPPQVTFPHPEFFEIDGSPDQDAHMLLAAAAAPELEFKLFRLTSGDIQSLKAKAKRDSPDPTKLKAITGFNVVTAHLWRCKVLATAAPAEESEAEPSTVLYAVDVRARLDPPLPGSYTGNAVLSAYGAATRRELRDGPFFGLVEVVSEGGKRLTDEYARSAVDWGSVHRGFPRGDVFVSSWWRLGFAGVEYAWGRPRYSCPLSRPSRELVLLFPSMEGEDKGVNALVALPGGDMDRFHHLFYSFFN